MKLRNRRNRPYLSHILTRASDGLRASSGQSPCQTLSGSRHKRRLRILVDGDDLRVELERAPPLLVRAEAGALDPAEGHVHLGACGLRVDVQDSSLELVHEALDGAEVGGEDRSREPELDRVSPAQRLVEIGEAIERGDRPEDLLAGEVG